MARAGGTTRRMVPAASWSPEDYYRAIRHAHTAWLAYDAKRCVNCGHVHRSEDGWCDAPDCSEGCCHCPCYENKPKGVLEAADSGTTSLVESAASSASLDRTPCPGDALDTPTREETC